MIRRPRHLVETPEALDGPGSPGHEETLEAIAYYGSPDPQGAEPEFKKYKHETVEHALNRLFHGKCAYCETPNQGGSDMDVEHFRPKKAIKVGDELLKPGYYWLGAEWTNLFPSCKHCNQRRRQVIYPSGEERSVGKMNQFPIANPDERARRPGEEERERPLLLNPCRDYPARALVFGTDGVVQPGLYSNGRPKPKGVHSIRVFALNRIGLCEERKKRRKRINSALELLTELLERNNGRIAEQDLRLFELQLEHIKGFAAPDANYAGMARQMIEAFFERHGLREVIEDVLEW